MVSDNGRDTDQQHPAPTSSSIKGGDAPTHQPVTDGQQAVTEQTLVERIDRSDRWMICLTGAIAFCGLISAIIFGWQLTVMQGQLNEMQADQRPWVKIDVLPRSLLVSGEGVAELQYSYRIKNIGNGVAVGARIVARAIISSQLPANMDIAQGLAMIQESICTDFIASKETETEDKMRSGVILFPNEQYPENSNDLSDNGFWGVSYIPESGVPRPVIKGVRADWFTLYLVGCVTYQLRLEPGRHQTGFIYRVVNLIPTVDYGQDIKIGASLKPPALGFTRWPKGSGKID